MDISSFVQSILQNQVVTGLSFTALLGGAVYQLRNIPHLIHRGALRFFTVELTVLSSDPSFDWLDRWMARQPYTKKSKMMRLRAIEKNEYRGFDDDRTEWTLSPGPGLHMFFWRRRPVLLERVFLSKDAVDSSARVSKPIEQLNFRTIGRSQAIIRSLIEEARSLSEEDELVGVRVWAEYHWAHVRGKSRRYLDTIILKPGQADRILTDLQWFIESRDWYIERGIPYRRGYLFSGFPGTGKTSVVLALAGYLQRPICVLNLGSMESDNGLFEAMREAPINAIILIEDIDCAFSALSRETNGSATDDDKAEGGRIISKAAMLNALDGIMTPEGRIFIMTTNFPERLDPALIRPGRADVHETFGYFDAAEQICMAHRFFDDFEPLPFPVSPAEMQAAFMQFHDDAKDARAYLLAKLGTVLEGNA
jgi:chaperone BCS1